MKTCYVVFDSNPTKEYAYGCGNLTPVPGQFVVVLVRGNGGSEKRKKLVKCTDVRDSTDPIVSSIIFGIVQEQPNVNNG